MNRRTVFILVLSASLFLLASGLAAGQASTQFDLAVSTLGSGGGLSTSAGFALEGILGQSFAEVSTAGQTQVSSGLMALVGGVQLFAADAYEADDVCSNNPARQIPVNAASAQVHSFHREGDQDWLFFHSTANKTFIITVESTGAKLETSPAILALYENCDTFGESGGGSFGSIAQLEFNAPAEKDYYLQIQPLDPLQYGSPQETRYTVRVDIDGKPPVKPTNTRCEPKSPTSVGIQWAKSPSPDVAGYRIQFAGVPSGSQDADGKNTTYYELGSLTAGQTYQVSVSAFDFSNNISPAAGPFPCVPNTPQDLSSPVFSLTQPGDVDAITTSAPQLTFTGDATDAGGNLARARVISQQGGIPREDNSLSGAADSFRAENVPLATGINNVTVSLIDAAGNQSSRQVTVNRLGLSPGAVLILAGHNESFGLQSNIYFMANRTYRIFKNAGYDASSIFYLAPVNQDADGDGSNDVDAISTPANIQAFLSDADKVRSKVGANKPLFIYMADHGFTEKFCAAGCSSGAVTADKLDLWLRALETASGLNQVNIVIEACQSGSFIDRIESANSSLSKVGRVVITSTGRLNNAYASAQGAYFSDAFFSCLVDSNDLKTCFDEGRAAVLTAGVDQTPWLDDNGDGVFQGEGQAAPDGAVAKTRVVTQNFSSNRPSITQTTVPETGSTRTLSADISEGAEEIELVWATVYPPGFQEPTGVTLNLGVPTVRLEEVQGQPGRYEVPYAGFGLPGDYDVVFYAQDAEGIAAIPRPAGFVAPPDTEKVYLPLIGGGN